MIGNKLRVNLLKNEQRLPGDPSNCRFAISRLDNETLSTFLYNRYANCGVDTILCQSHAQKQAQNRFVRKTDEAKIEGTTRALLGH